MNYIYELVAIYSIWGGHFESQNRPLYRNFSAWHHSALDSAYLKMVKSDEKPKWSGFLPGFNIFSDLNQSTSSVFGSLMECPRSP